MRERICVDISPGAAIFLALGVLVLPLRWMMGISLAAAVHELSHIAALILMGISIDGIHLKNGGVFLQVGPMTSRQEGICAAAGPVGSFLLLGMIRFYPEAALCGLSQGCFNLLPVYPFDGGRILYAVLAGFFPDREAVVMRFCSVIAVVCIPASIVLVSSVLYRYRIICFLGGLILLRQVIGKIPCNAHGLEVQ